MALLPMVQEEFIISRAQVGLYSSFYFLSAALIAVYSGKIVDLLGTKNSLLSGVAIIGVMMILHALAPLYNVILGLAFFTGIAFSIITPSVNRGVLEIARPSERSISMGIVHGSGGLGGVLGAVLMPYLAVLFGWRTALLFGSFLALIVVVLLYRYYHSSIESADDDTDELPASKRRSLSEDLKIIIRNRYLISFFLMGITFGVSISTVTGHFPLYLTLDLGYSATLAGLGLGVYHTGGILGTPIWGLINDRVFRGNRRTGLFLLGMLTALFSLLFGLVVSSYTLPAYAVLVLTFLLGFCTLGIITLYFTAVGEQVTKTQVATVTGIALIFPRTSTMIAPPLFGLLADFYSSYMMSWIFLGVLVSILSIAFFYLSGKNSRTS